MFSFIIKIIICILVVFCIHSIWQKIQDQCFVPKVKNQNVEIEKYKSILDQISSSHKSNKTREMPSLEKISSMELPLKPMDPQTIGVQELEQDLNQFLDSILVQNHIEIIP